MSSLTFNNDGTKLFVADQGADAGDRAVIIEFDLSSPFDFGTTSGSISPNITAMRDGTNINEFCLYKNKWLLYLIIMVQRCISSSKSKQRV